jgi:hypothetical protein
MKMLTRDNGNLERKVVHIEKPPLWGDDGLVTVMCQEYRGKTQFKTEYYPADRVPNVGDEMRSTNSDGEIPETFVVIEVKHLALPSEGERIRYAVLLLKKTHHV